MSRIGSRSVAIPKGATYKIETGIFYAEGPKGKLSVELPPCIELETQDNAIVFKRKDDLKQSKAYHGLVRNLVKNALIGSRS